MRKVLIATALLVGCGGDEGGGTGTAASGSAGSEDTAGDMCIPGEERCECNQGQCLSGLVCASNVCVALPNDPTAPADGDSGGSSSDGGGETGDGSCFTNDDCFSFEVCVDGYCADAWSQSYEISIIDFTGCPVDGSGGAEIFYHAKLDDSDLYTSATSGCPAGWGNESFLLEDFSGAFSVDFWEEDAFSDDFITSLCWDTFGDEACGPFPATILHDGYWFGSFGAEGAYDVEIEITLFAP